MGWFTRLWKTPVAQLLRINRRTSAGGLYVLAAIVLVWSAACDVTPTARQLGREYAYQDQVRDAEDCITARFEGAATFEKRGQVLETELRPYARQDREAVFLQSERGLRSTYHMSFVKIDEPKSLQNLNAGAGTGAVGKVIPDPETGPLDVHTVQTADEQCLTVVLNRPTPEPVQSGDLASTPTPLPIPPVLVPQASELEARGETKPTIEYTSSLASIQVAIDEDRLTYTVQRDDKGARVLDSKTRVDVFCVAMPAPAPSLDPNLLQSIDNPPTPAPQARGASPTPSPSPSPSPTPRSMPNLLARGAGPCASR